MAEQAFTSSDIREQTGFRLAVVFPQWQTDAAGVIDFHEELDRFEKEVGTTNVIGSLFRYEGALALGVFINTPEIVPGEVVVNELDSAFRMTDS